MSKYFVSYIFLYFWELGIIQLFPTHKYYLASFILWTCSTNDSKQFYSDRWNECNRKDTQIYIKKRQDCKKWKYSISNNNHILICAN